jgi:hypothetical protein
LTTTGGNIALRRGAVVAVIEGNGETTVVFNGTATQVKLSNISRDDIMRLF